jgi:toxin FitB
MKTTIDAAGRIVVPKPLLRPSATAHRHFVLELPDHEVTGGAAYDALVAATAAAHDAVLHTCDRRAAAVYESYGARTKFLA